MYIQKIGVLRWALTLKLSAFSLVQAPPRPGATVFAKLTAPDRQKAAQKTVSKADRKPRLCNLLFHRPTGDGRRGAAALGLKRKPNR